MTDLTDALPFWEGFSISSLEVLDEVFQVTLEPHAEAALACSGCGHNCTHVHEWRWRQIRELPMLGRGTTQDQAAPGSLLQVRATHRARVVAGAACPHHQSSGRVCSPLV